MRVTEGEPTSHGQRVRFEVADTGIGIEPGAAGRLFEPFSQADSSTTRTLRRHRAGPQPSAASSSS